MTAVTRKRLNWLLILQGWAILCVVVGHAPLLSIAQGNTGGNSAYYSHMKAELYIYRPQAVYPSSYAHEVGRPTACAGTVGSYSGFLSGTVHADSITGATEAERQEIEQAISQGVFV